MKRGDEIQLVTEFGTFIYFVTAVRTILPSDTWILKQTKQPTLLLTTCTPRFSASHRLIVFASS